MGSSEIREGAEESPDRTGLFQPGPAHSLSSLLLHLPVPSKETCTAKMELWKKIWLPLSATLEVV